MLEYLDFPLMHGLSVWKATSSELNLFSTFFWLHAGVSAVLRSLLYWDDSSKESPTLHNQADKQKDTRISENVSPSSSKAKLALRRCAPAVNQQEQWGDAQSRGGRNYRLYKTSTRRTMSQTSVWEKQTWFLLLFIVPVLYLYSLFLDMKNWSAKAHPGMKKKGGPGLSGVALDFIKSNTCNLQTNWY